ncbi:LysR family transcriptional regulator [Streptomyces hoynatensis]|uniref:LysR family transcriptional regulator n=1 Tax=Streptomyces hoynatensis TaxID=1141874 RepID=A0A3A9Z8V8_9ACTN|nr:LysR family transcriptional regulator [Streptomyces hoynatensis]RKN44780.1 LysR family transcriptional regulator [Streptomyces hoynatensis]
MELRQLRYFVTVAEERHFGRAAERLHIGQPAVSQQIRRLERELGADLFDRSPRHVRLTPAGERFLPEARAVLAAESRALAVAAAFAQEYAGTLRLGTSAGLGSRLDDVLDALARRAPHLAVELVAAPTGERLDRVAAGSLDATFVRGARGGGALRFLPLWEEPLVIALPARHRLSRGRDVALADLAPLPLRLVPRHRNPALADLVAGACREAGFAPLPGPPAGSLHDTLAAIGAGPPTWTVVYASQAGQLRPARVAFRPPRGRTLALTTALCVRAEAPTPFLPLLRAACAAAGDRHE